MRTPADDEPVALDRTSPLSLLLLEDSAADSELFQSMLEDELPGATITPCRTLAEARALLATGHYDVVLADLGLPDAHGLGVVQAVRDADRSPALLVLTGRDDSTLALTALSFGAQDYLVKGHHDAGALATAVLHSVQRQRTERARHLYLQMAKGLLDAIEAPTCAVDRTGRIVAVNQAWRGYALSAGSDPDRSAVGSNYLTACETGMVSPDHARVSADVATGLRDVLEGRRARFETEYPCHGPSTQSWFTVRISPTEIDGSVGAVISHVDVTVMHQVQESLVHQAAHDTLTGLPNRLLLTDRLEQALADSGRSGTDVAVAFLDLDHFKRVNDSLGHPVGDHLLRQVAERLSGVVRAGDTLSRFAGDEFVVVLRSISDARDAERLCERLLGSLGRPFELDGSTVVVTASVGVVIGRAPQTADEMLLSADAAMYDAKSRGRGRVKVFTPELRRDAEARLAVETGLRSALARGELVLHYQPLVDLSDGRALGAEALVRWQHPERGLLGPDVFIPVAEATGLILPLGAWVLDRACADAAAWTGALEGLEVAVNLSTRQLSRPDIVDQVAATLATSGLEPSRLLLEVTESAMMVDADAAGEALTALAGLGVRIAVDDFGTGYSSLLYLRRYPIDVLKVDRAFVSGVVSNADDHAICASVVSLGRAVEATTIAEGVETLEQLAALQAMGCQRAQGFLWSPGVPLSQLPDAVSRIADVPLPEPGPLTRIRVPRATAGGGSDPVHRLDAG